MEQQTYSNSEQQILELLKSSDRNRAELSDALQLRYDRLNPLLEGLKQKGAIESYFRDDSAGVGVLTYRLVRGEGRSPLPAPSRLGALFSRTVPQSNNSGIPIPVPPVPPNPFDQRSEQAR